MIKELIPIIEKRAKISVNDYLGKQPLTSPIMTITEKWCTYCGELNESGKKHGRGIDIDLNCRETRIGYWQNDEYSTGNYITIYSDGRFDVGEQYLKDGKRWYRGSGTRYKTDGTSEKYD